MPLSAPRKKPRKHTVRDYEKSNSTKVDSYIRGKDTESKAAPKVTVKTHKMGDSVYPEHVDIKSYEGRMGLLELLGTRVRSQFRGSDGLSFWKDKISDVRLTPDNGEILVELTLKDLSKNEKLSMFGWFEYVQYRIKTSDRYSHVAYDLEEVEEGNELSNVDGLVFQIEPWVSDIAKAFPQYNTHLKGKLL